MTSKKVWAIGALLLMLLTAACSGTQNSPATATPLNPGLFPPAGTTGPDSHTPVITPLSDGAAGAVTLPAGSATAMPLGASTVAGSVAPLVSPTAGTSGGASPAANSCVTPTRWVAYTVQAGDTLATLATAHNTTVDQLTTSNCLTNADVIEVGQTIYIPAP